MSRYDLKIQVLVSNQETSLRYRRHYLLLPSVSLLYQGCHDFRANYETDLLNLGYKATYNYDSSTITLKVQP
jgi:hypothetical protein